MIFLWHILQTEMFIMSRSRQIMSRSIMSRSRLKVSVRLCLQIFSHKDNGDPFLVWPPEGSSSVFLQTLGAIFVRIFSDFAQIFDKSKLKGVRLQPASYTTV